MIWSTSESSTLSTERNKLRDIEKFLTVSCSAVDVNVSAKLEKSALEMREWMDPEMGMMTGGYLSGADAYGIAEPQYYGKALPVNPPVELFIQTYCFVSLVFFFIYLCCLVLTSVLIYISFYFIGWESHSKYLDTFP